jgi:hypothetical protein
LAGTASAPLPLDSWVYHALDRLAGLGLVDSALTGTRPWSRLEAARLVAEAKAQAEDRELPPVARRLLVRLEAELHDSLGDLGLTDESPAAGYFKPVRLLSLSNHYREGEPAFIAGTNARQFALDYNNDGIEYDEGHNGQLLLESEARLGGMFLVNLRPLFSSREGGDTSARLLQGTAALALGPVELSAGRQSLWWGQGRHGALVLTNNAKPLDMVRVTNPSPVLLPWIFRYLGPFRFDFFVSRLEEERAVPEPYFGGLRLNFKPHPWFELGVARTAMIGGEGRPDVGFDDILTIIGGENLSGNDDTSNSVAAIDARLRLPPLGGAELYAEMGGEDEADLLGFIPFFANKAWLAGVYLPVLEPSRRLSLRLEYADLSHIDDNSPAWYRHEIYLSGYTYKKRIMGHHVGGAASDLYSELEILLPGDVTLGLSYDYEKRGADQVVEEKHYQPGVALEWFPSDNIALNARYVFDKVENFNFVPGDDRENHLAELGLTANW